MSVGEFVAKATCLSHEIIAAQDLEKEKSNEIRINMLKSVLLNNLRPEIKRGVIARNPQTIEKITEFAALEEKAWLSIKQITTTSEAINPSPLTVFAVDRCHSPKEQTKTYNVFENEMFQKFQENIEKKIGEISAKVEALSVSQSRPRQTYTNFRAPFRSHSFSPRQQFHNRPSRTTHNGEFHGRFPPNVRAAIPHGIL